MNVQTTTVPPTARRAVLTAAVVLLGLLAVLVGRADATADAPSSTLLSMGSTDDRIVVKTHPGESTTVRTVRVEFAAGQTTGWHIHPGPGIVTIHSGTFTLQRAEKSGCSVRQLSAKEVFVDDGTPHTLVAETAGVAFVTLITPTDAGSPTVPVAPAC